MAIRATDESIREILPDIDDSISSLTPFIRIANRLIDQWCTGDNGPTPVYPTDHLKDIESWLAAHFIKIADPQVESESIKGVSQKNATKVDLNLALTHYGQQAMLLDWNGGLASLNALIAAGGGTVSLFSAHIPCEGDPTWDC